MNPDVKLWFKRRRIWIGGCLALLLGGLGVVGAAGLLIWQVLDVNSPLMKPGAVRCACEWARLAPLPVPLSQVHVSTQGGMFTREFEVSFEGDPQVILGWLKKSPGTSADCGKIVRPSDVRLEITPGGGATFAEITVTKSGSQVVVRAYWS